MQIDFVCGGKADAVFVFRFLFSVVPMAYLRTVPGRPVLISFTYRSYIRDIMKLSRKALLPKPEGYEEEKPARGPRREGGNGGGRREGGDRGPRREGNGERRNGNGNGGRRH